jgi:hypothetical protein
MAAFLPFAAFLVAQILIVAGGGDSYTPQELKLLPEVMIPLYTELGDKI